MCNWRMMSPRWGLYIFSNRIYKYIAPNGADRGIISCKLVVRHWMLGVMAVRKDCWMFPHCPHQSSALNAREIKSRTASFGSLPS